MSTSICTKSRGSIDSSSTNAQNPEIILPDSLSEPEKPAVLHNKQPAHHPQRHELVPKLSVPISMLSEVRSRSLSPCIRSDRPKSESRKNYKPTNKSTESLTAKARRALSGSPKLRRGRKSKSSTSTTASENANFDPIEVSQHESNLIRDSWAGDFNSLYALGIDIYENIFKVSPELRDLFEFTNEPKNSDSDWQESPAARSQALKFVQVISYTITNLSRDRQRIEYLKDIGARHVQFVQRGFRPEHWVIAEGAIQEALWCRIQAREPNATLRDETMIVWRRIIDHIMKTMRLGFDEALANNGQAASSAKTGLNSPKGLCYKPQAERD